MIGHAIDAECDSAEFADDSTEVSVKVALDLYSNQRRPMTGAEDDMN